MKYQTIPPPAHLSDFVRCFWVLESDTAYTHYGMADVCPEMLFHYNGQFDEVLKNGRKEKSFTAGVHGQSSITRTCHINRGFGIFGVYLYPQAIPLLFGLPATEITNQMPDLGALLAADGRVLEEQMAEAEGTGERVRIITSFIERKLASNRTEQPPLFFSVRHILENKEILKVKHLAEKYFLSERQFERKFKHLAGFSPKLFSRIARFQSATAWYGAGIPSLSAIAYECGYYDQSHFIRDFKVFSGHNPRQFFSGNSEATAWRD